MTASYSPSLVSRSKAYRGEIALFGAGRLASAFRAKRSGSTPAGRERQPRTVSVMRTRISVSTRGMTAIPAVRPTLWGKGSQTPSGFMTCMVTCMSGVRIGMWATTPVLRVTAARTKGVARSEWSGVAIGSAWLAAAAPPFDSWKNPAVATKSSAFALRLPYHRTSRLPE